MVTSSVAISIAKDFLDELRKNSFDVDRAVLFGSFSKGTFHKDSDIDLALWSSDFEGDKFEDVPKIARILCQFPKIELHTFAIHENETNHTFIKEVIEKGIELTSVNQYNLDLS